MSEPIPESIPTSMDPRSRRPTKRVRPSTNTPTSLQAATLSHLFSQPDREIPIPPSNTSLTSSTTSTAKSGVHKQPPEIVHNVQGSSAGAGSGEFHVYKAGRRREYERLRQMDEVVRGEREEEVWAREKREREVRDEERTRRNREKRNRKKGKGGKGGKEDGGAGGGGGGGNVKARVGMVGDGDGDGVGMDRGDGGEGNGGEGGQGQVQEEVGVIIHDDD